YGWSLDTYRRRVESFGCFPIVIDGHDVTAIDRAYGQALSASDKPTIIIAKTIKGKGFSEIENKNGWHGKVLPPDMAERAIKELGGIRHLKVKTPKPDRDGSGKVAPRAEPVVTLPTYTQEDKVATRKAYGDALLALAAIPAVVAMDSEVSNSTHADEFAQAHPDRFFEIWIAEQQLVATAVGMSVRGYKPFASTFAAFFSRAYDFIRMAGISQANIRLVGSHAGVEIGPDGPSQMALEDLASIRAVHGSTVLYPCDPNQTAKLTRLMADTDGIVYMRTTRGAYPTLYGPHESFKVGGSKVLRQSPKDRVTLIGAGVTVHNCLAAADQLAAKKIPVRVIDLYSVKPVDVKTLREAVKATRGRLVIVEDHYPEGGIGAAVMEALAADGIALKITHLAVKGLPTSGKPEELMNAAGISSRQIIAAATKLAQAK
ncbi:MAG TPA: transketolase, partial [Candidatus Dormibacteraeota bacterium]